MQQWVAKSWLTWFLAFSNSFPMAFSTSIHFFRSRKASTTILFIYSGVVELGRKFNMYKTTLHSLNTPTKTTLSTSTDFSRLRRWRVASACGIGSVCLIMQPISQVHQIQKVHEELAMTTLSWLSIMSFWCSPLDLRWRSSLLAFYKWYHFDHRCNISNKRIWTWTWFQVDKNLQPLEIYEKLTILQNLFTSFCIYFAKV